MSFLIRPLARQAAPALTRRGVATLPGSGSASQHPHGILDQLSFAAPALVVGSLAGSAALAWRLGARRALLTKAERPPPSCTTTVEEWKAWGL